MFRSLKFYVGQTISVDEIITELLEFHYRRAPSVVQEGDFCQRGEVLDIFPSHYDSPVRIALDENTIRSIASFNIKSSKAIWQHKIILILPLKERKSSAAIFNANIPLNNFVDIQKGDYVVHNNYGIGKYLGITRLDALGGPGVNVARGARGAQDAGASPGGPGRHDARCAPGAQDSRRDHLVIEYHGGDKLFVPQHDIHLIQKYFGFTKRPPRLFKLGSKEWQRIKLHIQKKLQRFAAELLHIHALRASHKGHAFAKDTAWQTEFEKAFPFEETPDQIKSTQEVKADMESDFPMDRLLCGDVGFGKTEVALRGAFKAVMDNKQVAVLVPTTILAEQHFYNFAERFKNYPVNVAMLSRFRTKAEQTEILKKVQAGTVDVVIGTHRLLSNDIVFKDLGLIIIDEEQRFGVRAKEKLKHLRLLADVLMMTATPIPRTLYMALSGAKDMSVISTPPKNRVPVVTHVVEFDENLIQETIAQELKRHGQIFFLHNRVEDIEKIAKIITRLVPQARVGIAHGQMEGRLLEKIMLKFLKREIDVLVCTTIIESGIDIPNANTLIVNHAERFGLADLHQLRGRVGRFTEQAFAYFIIPPERILATIAKARLQALEKYSELGSGFQIAFEDLQIRGAGNILGEEQSGYIAAVGFDLYCRLLKESVEHLNHAKKAP